MEWLFCNKVSCQNLINLGAKQLSMEYRTIMI